MHMKCQFSTTEVKRPLGSPGSRWECILLLLLRQLYSPMQTFASILGYYGERLSACRPNPILMTSPPYLWPPRQGGPLLPSTPGTHFSRILRHAWTAVVLFFSTVTTWEGIILLQLIIDKYGVKTCSRQESERKRERQRDSVAPVKSLLFLKLKKSFSPV